MRYFLFAFFVCFVGVARAEFTCGPGYVLVSHAKIDGVSAAECQKLWCMDLETGKMMGRAGSAYSGYKDTNAAWTLEVPGEKSVLCWGERKWCTGQPAGRWDGVVGRYVRGGSEDAYESYQNGSCFSWRLKENPCKAGQDAKLVDGTWKCMEKENSEAQVRGSVIRRTSVPRRILR